MTNYEALYSGAKYLLEPTYQFTGYRVPSGELGGTTSIQTANQLDQVNKLLNQGMKATEISVINPEVFEMIPQEHFKEIYRLNKLTGAESTVHAPTLDPSGFGEQGWSEEQRKMVERQFEDFVTRSHDLNPKGNIPVTIHSSVIPGSELITEKHELVRPDEKGNHPLGRMIAIDQETGKLIPLEREKLYSPMEPQGRIYSPEDRLEMANATKWVKAIRELAFLKKTADELLVPAYANIANVISKGKITKEDLEKNSGDFQKMERAGLFLDDIESSFRNLYEQASKYGDDDTKKVLKGVSQEWQDKRKLMQQKAKENPFEIPIIKSNLIDKSIDIFQQLESTGHSPAVYKQVEDFAKEKASETLSQVALKSYKQFGSTSPIISIENPPYGQAIATGQDLKELVEKTREKFAKKLSADGASSGDAKAIAERIIGATWDTSHISMIRKQGFGKEKIVEETKKIAPFIKHVHFNDNFGSTHTDLPPGMGNAPIKDILQVLEKNNVKAKKIFEGGNFFQHFQKSPFPYTLQYSGSPMWAGAPPYFNQLGGLGNYYSGHGAVNPSLHHTLYGSGFTTLPLELGGEMPGERGRFSGTPNQ